MASPSSRLHRRSCRRAQPPRQTGHPRAASTFSVASAIARRRNSGLGALVMLNLPYSSPRGESKHSMAQAFRSTRVLTPAGLMPAALLVEGERIVAHLRMGRGPAAARLSPTLAIPSSCPAWWIRMSTSTSQAAPNGKDSHSHPGRRRGRRNHAGRHAAELHARDHDRCGLESKRPQLPASRGWTGRPGAEWFAATRSRCGRLPNPALPGFKCFLMHSGIDGFSWVDEAAPALRSWSSCKARGCRSWRTLKLPGPLTPRPLKLNEPGADWRSYSTYLPRDLTQPRWRRSLSCCAWRKSFKSPIHIVHLSTAEALPLLAEARQRGVPVTVETCTQYLWFAAEEIPDGATEFKCAPPIRGAANREALMGRARPRLIESWPPTTRRARRH